MTQYIAYDYEDGRTGLVVPVEDYDNQIKHLDAQHEADERKIAALVEALKWALCYVRILGVETMEVDEWVREYNKARDLTKGE